MLIISIIGFVFAILIIVRSAQHSESDIRMIQESSNTEFISGLMMFLGSLFAFYMAVSYSGAKKGAEGFMKGEYEKTYIYDEFGNKADSVINIDFEKYFEEVLK